MSRQDKATTEKFTRTLRELVKRPENKVCADCKRNDPRWASWNIGVFLCIRCSGIHRGMGTHISKVKSVDLDTWTPEQMESIQKWGNYLANLYWEAHLKPGHVPPEHKMESFVRSKYESRRWALDGPPPTDPSVLANGAQPVPAPVPQPQPAPAASSSRPTHVPSASLSTRSPAPVTTRQPQARQLLSTNYTNTQRQPTSGAAPSPVVAKAPSPPPAQRRVPENDLFSLDFHAPPTTAASTASEVPKKDVKQDILSLFSSPPPASAPTAFGQFGTQPAAASSWGAQPTPAQQQMWQQQQQQAQQQQQHAATSMLGTSGVGVWGTSSGWGAATAAPAPPAGNSLWGSTPAAAMGQQQGGLFNTTAVWGSAPAPAPAPAQDLFGSFGGASSSAGHGAQTKKDDVFGDLWGGFK